MRECEHVCVSMCEHGCAVQYSSQATLLHYLLPLILNRAHQHCVVSVGIQVRRLHSYASYDGILEVWGGAEGMEAAPAGKAPHLWRP